MQSVGKTGLLSQVDKASTCQPVRLAAQPRVSRPSSEADSTDIQVLSQVDLSMNEAWSRTTRDRTRGSDWTCILASQYKLVRYGRHKDATDSLIQSAPSRAWRYTLLKKRIRSNHLGRE